MSFLISTAVLMVMLVAAALIGPRPFHDLTLRVDPCALEPREWGVIDPSCPGVHMGKPSWTRADRSRGRRLDEADGAPDHLQPDCAG